VSQLSARHVIPSSLSSAPKLTAAHEPVLSQRGFSPLQIAASATGGDPVACIDALAAAGADHKALDKVPTPATLTVSPAGKSLRARMSLLTMCAAPRVQFGMTVLHTAADKENSDVMAKLLTLPEANTLLEIADEVRSSLTTSSPLSACIRPRAHLLCGPLRGAGWVHRSSLCSSRRAGKEYRGACEGRRVA
jgi:hypothetical protein